MTPSIVTNMAFWQSGVWTAATASIYPMQNRTSDPDHLPWWQEAWRLYRERARYDVVLTMGAREALTYGLLCAMTGVRSKQIFTEVFIDDPHPRSVGWRLKVSAFRLVARRALGILTNSSMEVATNAERFALPRDRFRYVPLHCTTPDAAVSTVDEGYVLAAGRSLRDYATLLAAAPLIARPIVIVCGATDLQGATLPPNVELHRELPRAAYLEKLRRCSLVALPLLVTGRATGQVVALEAMACGKPVVTTRSPGTTDIVRDGVNGLLVEPGDSVGLAQAIQALCTDTARATTLARQAREDLSTLYTFDRHAQAKLDAIADLFQRFAR